MSLLSKTIRPLLYKDLDTTKVTNVLFVDQYVKGYETVVNSVNASTFAVSYCMKSQRSELLALLRRKFTKIQRIGFFFDSNLGNPKMFLQTQNFFNNNDTENSENLQFLIQLIKEFKIDNVDFLACNTLQYPNWVNYYSILKSQTGVVVGASNDNTGNLKYGGNWVLENTHQNVEMTYFTESIEYYQYVLDNPAWAGGFAGPSDIDVSGQYMYVTNKHGGTTVSRIDLTDTNNPTILPDWLSGFESPLGLAINGKYLYVSNSSYQSGYSDNNCFISRVDLDTMHVNYHWLDLSYGDVFTGSVNTGISTDTSQNLYISDIANNTIIKVNTQDVNDITYDWSTGFSNPFFSVVHGDKLYVADQSGYLYIVRLSDGVSTNVYLDYGLSGIAISGDYMYVSSFYNIYVLNLSDLSVVSGSEAWTANISTEINAPMGMKIYDNQLYIANYYGETVGQYDLYTPSPPPPPPIYVSCLLEGTQVWTLDGYVPIESLKVGDSIRTNHYSIAVTKVGKWKVDLNSEKDRADLGKKMYKIPAGQFGATSDTFISHYHRILYYMDEECSSRGYDIPSHLGLEVARPTEFAVDGKYTLYHLQLAIGNHFVVNGGCMVEAWNPENEFF